MTRIFRILGLILTLCLGISCGLPPETDTAISLVRPGDPVNFGRTLEPIQGEYIVVLNNARESVALRSTDLTARFRGRLRNTFQHAIQGFMAEMSEADAKALARDPSVRLVQENGIFHASATQTGPTWGIDRIDQRSLPLDSKYTYTADGRGVNAYILDTGIYIAHSDFGGRASYGFSSIDDGKGAEDCHGHGTHVSGTIGGTKYGVAKGVNLIAVRVLTCQGSGTTDQVIAGVDWLTANAKHPAVANMSLGGGVDAALDAAVQGAVASGIVFVLASGNEGQNACNVSPARVPEAITVSATTNADKRPAYSNWGTCVDIFAPGSNITSDWKGGSTATSTASGTSMASPHVAGAAALYLQGNPQATPAAVSAALVAAATSGAISNPNNSPNKLLYTADFGGGGGDTCGGETARGRCEANVVVRCENNQVTRTDCAAQGKTCGLDTAADRYTCLDQPPEVCPGVPPEGVCEGNTLVTCVNGTVKRQACGWFLRCKFDAAQGKNRCMRRF